MNLPRCLAGCLKTRPSNWGVGEETGSNAYRLGYIELCLTGGMAGVNHPFNAGGVNPQQDQQVLQLLTERVSLDSLKTWLDMFSYKIQHTEDGASLITCLLRDLGPYYSNNFCHLRVGELIGRVFCPFNGYFYDSWVWPNQSKPKSKFEDPLWNIHSTMHDPLNLVCAL